MLSDRSVKSITLIDKLDFATSQEVTRKVNLGNYSCAEGRFAIECVGTAGGGKINIAYKVSIDNISYTTPTDSFVIDSAGITAKRNNFNPHDPTFSRFMEFTILEKGSGDIEGVTVTLIMQ